MSECRLGAVNLLRIGVVSCHSYEYRASASFGMQKLSCFLSILDLGGFSAIVVYGCCEGVVLRACSVGGKRAMAPRLKLPNNFRVKTLWSSRNNLGVGDLQAVSASDALSVPIVISSATDDLVTHISETRLSDSAPELPELNFPSETTVVSPEPTCTWRRRKTGAVHNAASNAPPKKKTAPSIVTRKWQAVWACKYTWAQDEFDADGNLCGVVCLSCSTITRRRKVIVPKV